MMPEKTLNTATGRNAPEMADKVIEVVDLVKKYNGRNAVLDGVSFSVGAGEFVTIYGKSGCGKTTLLNVLGGLDRPTAGSVKIDGQDLGPMTEDDLAKMRLEKIGFVFQDFNLLLDMTVRENVALPLRFSRRKDGGRIDSLLDKFDIKHIADEPANTISGGEAQRTAIARAMMNNPKILLADEPTGNLDEENAANVLSMFERVREDFRATIVTVTHRPDFSKTGARLFRLADGRLEQN